MPLGATRPVPAQFGVVSATNVALRDCVDSGRFRNDLYFRVGRPLVALPPLRERPEEMPWILAHTLLAAGGMVPHVSLAESVVVRPWPGNVRELLLEIRAAAAHVQASGGKLVRGSHLPSHAGVVSAPSGAAASPPAPGPDSSDDAQDPSWRGIARSEVMRVLGEAGTISAAARVLGLHRTQLKRLMERFGIGDKGSSEPGDDK
jgi:transcriptional regulator of acetoin/glycerol metabolism